MQTFFVPQQLITFTIKETGVLEQKGSGLLDQVLHAYTRTSNLVTSNLMATTLVPQCTCKTHQCVS